MKGVRVFVLLFFLIFPLRTLADNTVHIRADHISYNKDLAIYYAYGRCLVYDSQYSLKADTITYSDNTSVAEAKGNVFLKDFKGNWIKGDYAKINYSNYQGFVKNAVMFIKGDGLYVKAKRIIMYDKSRYFIKDGTITSCKCDEFLHFNSKCHPKWTVNATNTYIVKDDYLFSYPVVMKARSIPVFALPFTYRNLSRERKTGFLMPQFGVSSEDGTIYVQPFFINISPSQDITLYPFAYSKKGNGMSAEYRFYWTKQSKGKWDITVFKEKTPYENSKSKHTRVNLKAKQWADFGKYGTFNYKLNIVNNRNNLRVLNRSNIELSSDRYTLSTASYYLSHNEYFLSVYGNYRQDLVSESNKETLQDLPIVKFGAIGKKLYKNLTLDFTQTIANKFRIKGQRGIYTDSSGFLYYPFKVSYFSITPKIGAHSLWSRWKNAPDKDKHYQRSFIPDYIISASTQIIGVFLNDNTEGFKGIKHTIKPTIKYEYIPERSQRFPDFVDTYSKTNLITFTLENSLISKYLEENPIYKDLLYNKIVVQYDFAKKYHTPFPPVYEETQIKPFDFLSFNSKAHYFFKKHLFTDSTESLEVSNKKAGFSVGYSMSRDSDYNLEDDTVNSKVYFYPIEKLYLYAEAKRSTIHDYFPERKFGFMYNEDCWGIGIDFYFNRVSEEDSDGNYSTHLDKGFWITLNLTGLFSIKRQY